MPLDLLSSVLLERAVPPRLSAPSTLQSLTRVVWHLSGGAHTSQALFRRSQLKALVGMHSESEGLGGTLSSDEISIIQVSNAV